MFRKYYNDLQKYRTDSGRTLHFFGHVFFKTHSGVLIVCTPFKMRKIIGKSANFSGSEKSLVFKNQIAIQQEQ